MCADSFVVELCVVYAETINNHALWYWRLHIGHVKHVSTLLTAEVSMRCCIAIVAYVMLVNGNHECPAPLREHPEGVIYGGATNGWDVFFEFVEYLIDGRMSVMCL